MKKLLCAAALVAATIAPAAAEAQMNLGPIAGFHDDHINFGIGAYAGIPVPQLHENITIAPSFMYYFPDGDLNAWELNGDVVYSFPVSGDSPVLPFALAGLNIFHVSVDVPSVTVGGISVGGGSAGSTDLGLNLGGGIVIPAESVTPFVGAKFEIQDGTGFVIFGGVGFAVGG